MQLITCKNQPTWITGWIFKLQTFHDLLVHLYLSSKPLDTHGSRTESAACWRIVHGEAIICGYNMIYHEFWAWSSSPELRIFSATAQANGFRAFWVLKRNMTNFWLSSSLPWANLALPDTTTMSYVGHAITDRTLMVLLFLGYIRRQKTRLTSLGELACACLQQIGPNLRSWRFGT